MKLVDVYSEPAAAELLYSLLRERDEITNISHRVMPSWYDHLNFIGNRPYAFWYLVEANGYVGSAYLSRQDEIGIAILKAHQGKGYGPEAVTLLMAEHPRHRYLANINPRNERSVAMFQSMGFGLLQQTYELRQ